jgi:hypothetical protein
MKNLLALALIVTSFAQADFVPGRERAVMRAKLSQIEGLATFPRATSLSLNKIDGVQKPSSFTLVEDTGIRCVTAPCPSEKTTKFKIVNISNPIRNADKVTYEAIEVLTNIPANVKIAPRKLTVVETSMELVAPGGNGFQRRLYWEVQVLSFPNDSAVYTGNPQHLLITMDAY